MAKDDATAWAGLFRLSTETGQTLQAQIRQAVVAAILDRQISASMPLPSCRILAQKLGVARGTVVLAFQQLVDQGFLVARERRGHFVNPEMLSAATVASPKRSAETVDWKARKRVAFSPIPASSKSQDWMKAQYPFVYGQFDPSLFPTAEWRECNRMALAVLEIRNWAADMVDRDDPLLIEQIQARLLPRRGIFAAPDEIIVTLGAQNALYMLATLLMGNGSKVAMEEPGYSDARSIFKLAGCEIVPIGVDSEGLIIDQIPADVDYVFTTPSHQCPTMVPLSPTRREALLERAQRDDFVIIEDGYDSQLFDNSPQQALRSMDQGGRVIYVGSMSKTLAPGLRIGYVVASRELIAELRTLRRFMFRHPPANNQRAVALFLSLGHHDSLIRRLSTAFEERRRCLVQALDTYMPDWEVAPDAGGSSVWLRGPEGTNAALLEARAAKLGIMVESGDRFFAAGIADAPYLRLGISSIAAHLIEPGIKTLASLTQLRAIAA
ncbi:PLP-dependent aminotransferase family protein [Limoniibacter endophyticus]|uniref:GntR family transcriptional regulator n=1 Tax=Limoniibacter endophyticus TaxID=1565040 RepID=A0A8J3DLM8_9HYPH|nr:PLP-dependent aminotransferase family protein [Limoniibacter endophyticus]GHC80056.1 GntR family transcriptional regulator [Limoniibacter endophyticus]